MNLAELLDELFRAHHNGYDDADCACGRPWYDDNGHWHLTQLILEIFRDRP